jgi:hypothetical protein
MLEIKELDWSMAPAVFHNSSIAKWIIPGVDN